MKSPVRALLFCGVLAWLTACTIGSDSAANREATVEALGRAVVQTATATTGEELSPEDGLATAEAAATEAVATIESHGTEVAATVTAAVANGAPSPPAPTSPIITTTSPPTNPLATPDAELAGIQAELAAYGIDPAGGTLGAIHPPVTLQAEGFQQFDASDGFATLSVENFVLAADMTWNTTYGDAGCGFILRSTSADPAGSSQYLVAAIRRDEGRVIFQTRLEGEPLLSDRFELMPNLLDPSFQWQNNQTNRMVIVARGNEFTIYTNGALLGTITPQSRLGPGLAAFVAVNDSGNTNCYFDNGWLWLLP
ncbi:MAG: hypothetical protein L0332_34190 [Chloroflexi bacterium]|nr:hypothetical protein [Chloroflexota bacterium]MCI0581202.1 hypothetical protein [Chloroflexota bacterium]MCI0644126.1 hypothetical protein [Chloroflexota bacterium]MCI0731747.1 hypothetical protein [Chloroflexota bacterium]